MAKTILINGGQSFIVSGGASYWDFNLIGNLGTSYTGSAALKLLFHNAGTLSNATIYISTNTRNAVLTLTGRKNSSDGNISVSITALGTGFFEDVSHTDSVTSGDTYQYRLDYGGTTEGGLTIQNIQTTFSATTDTVSILGHGQDAIDSWATSTTFWLGLWPLDTDNASGNTEANRQIEIRKAGSFKNLAVYVYFASSAAHTFKLRKNGGDAISISLTANTSGWFEETSTTSTAAVGDDYCFSFVTGANTTNLSINTWKIDYINTSGYGMTCVGDRYMQAITKGLTRYNNIGGSTLNLLNNNSETGLQYKSRDTYTFSELEAYVVNGTITGNYIKLRKNGADTALAITIPSGHTGLVQDTSNTVTVAAGDLMNFVAANVYAGGGSRNLNVYWVAVWYEGTATGGGELKYGTISETSVSVSESLARLQIKLKPISETSVSVNQTLARVQTLLKEISDTPTVSVSEILVRGLSYPRPITTEPDVTIPLETLAKIASYIRTIDDTPSISVSETLARIQSILKEISETPSIDVSESITRGLYYLRPIDNESSISISAGLLERIQYLIKQITTEPDVTIPLETLEKVAAYPRPISDTPTISVSETLERIRSSLRSISDTPTIDISELLAKSTLFPKAISDTPTVSISETLERIQSIIKQITNEPEVTISELIAGNFLISRIIEESPSISVSETLERIQTALRSISDTPEIIISELLTGSVPVIIKNISEPSVTTDPTTIERLATFLRSITVAEEPLIDVSDTLASILSYLRNIANEPEITTNDVAAILALMTRTLAEPSQNISEDLARIQSILKEIAESPTIDTSDAAIALKLQTILLFESRIKWYYSTLTRKIPAGEV